ncbi:two-component system sensor histidine kinase/response regulator, hybrid [hydrocarbon metagenome]|uniref:histidine kinase n=1 Tax=hydrocarbon metagenome TaxID=938273 RepID=A0A0W8FVI5_9ZZZZ
MFDPIEKTFTNYDYQDGLQSNEFNSNAFMKSKSGTLYFGGINGFNYFNPSSIELNTKVPNIVFTDLYLFNKKLDVGEMVNDRIILEKPITVLETLVLNYSDNIFTIYFSSLDFSAPGKNLYCYKLEDFENEFSNSTSNRFVTYTNLNPGKYVLTVRGSNNNNLWNESGASLVLIIKPPFWLTWWFFMIAASLIVFILYSVYKYRINKILELERLRVKIASDLHDEVGSTLTKVSMRAQMLEMQINGEKESKNLKRISEQAREAVSTMQDIVWAIDSRNDGFNNLIDRMKDTAFSVLTEKNIKVDFSESGIDSDEKLNLEMRQNLYLILKEAVHNIIKHSDASEVNISLTNSDAFLTMMIADNGRSYKKKEHHTGQGLRNIEMRAKKINAECEFKHDNGFIVIVKTPPIL